MWRSALRRACRQHETVIGQTRIGTVLRDDVDLTLIGAYLFDRPLNETNADRIENVHQRCAHEISIGLVKSWAMATVDGEFHGSELRAIGDVLHGEWGYDRDYIAKAVASLTEQVSHQTVPTLVDRLQDFLEANPDCNRAAMNDDLMEFVREIVGADGFIRPEEEQALHEIAAAFATAGHRRFDQSSTSG